MRINSFKIKNFRSIVDSRWVTLSPDGITAFVGQNESGKSSVLEAIYFALSGVNPTEDDFRTGTPLPEISLNLSVDYNDLISGLDDRSPQDLGVLRDYLGSLNGQLIANATWNRSSKDSKRLLTRSFSLNSTDLENRLKEAADKKAGLDAVDSQIATAVAAADSTSTATATEQVESSKAYEPLTVADFEDAVWQSMPNGVLFNEVSGRLPNQVDIDDNGLPKGEGAKAAQNFLSIAGIDLPSLVKSDRRTRENTLNKANARVSEDFNSFWSQTIGKSGRLSLKCDIENYDDSTPEKSGKPHLVFWIRDGETQLYPKQRSQGVRWFISFYLQLKASEKSGTSCVFLLDEPGANLHSKAQGDVLKLINKLGKDTSSVIYSTHSPQLLEYPKLFRVHAVQRDDELDESPSQIIDAHRLGTASADTLSPVLSAMGVDLSNHQVIRKENNVLLEEMSGYYYISSFWKITGQVKAAHFLASTGVNKIEAMANMFRGWGLDFIVAVDDDKQGREALKTIKRELFGDRDDLAGKKLLKIPECPGIEDAFSAPDFRKLVLKNAKLNYTSSNADYVKSAGLSKPVLAFQFALLVEEQSIGFADFDAESQRRINAIVEAISSRLSEP